MCVCATACLMADMDVIVVMLHPPPLPIPILLLFEHSDACLYVCVHCHFVLDCLFCHRICVCTPGAFMHCTILHLCISQSQRVCMFVSHASHLCASSIFVPYIILMWLSSMSFIRQFIFTII